MSAHISSIIYVMLITTFALIYLKLAIEPIISKKEFQIWAISWFVVTALAFLTFNFLLFVFLSAIFIYFISKQVKNQLALYCLLLFAIPSYSAKVSVLFTINFTRELAIVLLLPLIKFCKPSASLQSFGKSSIDKLLVSYLLLIFLLYFRGLYVKVDPTTVTEGIRHGFYIFFQLFLPYYIASRYIKDFNQLKTVMIAFVSGCVIAASIAIVEIKKSWLLYGNLNQALKIDFTLNAYLERSNLIRASSTMDHPLILGLMMMIALGLFLFISELIKSKKIKFLGFGILAGGLIAPLSRGSWLGAALMVAAFFSLGYKRGKHIMLMICSLLVGIPALYFIPGGHKIINLLPFVGDVDKVNVDYRALLIQQSLVVIQKHPLFGVFDPTLEPEMQVLIQGSGIIDLVNYYLELTLTHGLVGLILFLFFFIVLVFSLYKHIGQIENKQSHEYLCGKSLLALLLGTLFTISTLSGLNMVSTVLFLLAGLTVSYMRITKDMQVITNGLGHQKALYPTSRVVQKKTDRPKPKGYLK